ncbi:hypothetical protein Q3G72_029345 [Acer saccharum]|nr:hypothetical protein Q3G72_029345 [Acer saccharum]
MNSYEVVLEEFDGVNIKTLIIDDGGSYFNIVDSLILFLEQGDTNIVGFDTEWSCTCDTLKISATKIILLKLCNSACLIRRLDVDSLEERIYEIFKFLYNKDILFAGVHIHKDLQKLHEQYGFEVRNLLDLSELSAQVLHQPLLKLHGVRELANKVLSKNLQPRQWINIIGDSVYDYFEDCTRGQIECATVDAY